MLTRRQLAGAVPLVAVAGMGATACAARAPNESYEDAAARIWRVGELRGLEAAAVRAELVRYATLAPSSHNTQCWKFASSEGGGLSIRPDFARRCPAVDPDDHHLYVSLGCAAENLIQAAGAFGLRGDAAFDPATQSIDVSLESAATTPSVLFGAITTRQCTRGPYDAKPISTTELNLLAAAAAAPGVRVLLLTERAALENVLQYVIEGNTQQMNDPLFLAELKSWVRFSSADAVRLGDGLSGMASGNPDLPAWLGRALFDLVVNAKSENDKCAKHLRSSAGVAVFVGERADPANWIEVGRSYERFALQATALGIRNAFINQPVEVAAIRPQFASFLGIGELRPDLAVRFGRGPAMPHSLRRAVADVMA